MLRATKLLLTSGLHTPPCGYSTITPLPLPYLPPPLNLNLKPWSTTARWTSTPTLPPHGLYLVVFANYLDCKVFSSNLSFSQESPHHEYLRLRSPFNSANGHTFCHASFVGGFPRPARIYLHHNGFPSLMPVSASSPGAVVPRDSLQPNEIWKAKRSGPLLSMMDTHCNGACPVFLTRCMHLDILFQINILLTKFEFYCMTYNAGSLLHKMQSLLHP